MYSYKRRQKLVLYYSVVKTLEENIIGKKFFGSWTIVEKIGEGSFGKVYKLERNDYGLIGRAALKIIKIPQSESEIKSLMSEGMDYEDVSDYLDGFVREIVNEIALMAKLKGNSNIVSYEDHSVVEHSDGLGWDILIRMEYLTPILEYYQSHNVFRKDIIKLGIDICSALELCQKYDIVHRDIKPENIFISENGDYKLGDFGIARTIEKTMGGLSKKGTYTYMAPEVYKGERYGTNIDIYSLGIVLYRFLNNNRTPFLPTDKTKVAYREREQALAKRMGGAELPPPVNATDRLAEIILKACAYDSSKRYSSPTQMKEDLQAVYYDSSASEDIFLGKDKINVQRSLFTAASKGQHIDTAKTPNEKTDSMFDPYGEQKEKTLGLFDDLDLIHKRKEEERLKKERLEKERLEKERLEKERLEKERLEKERLEKERLEKERLEKERLEKECLEKERLEKERLEKERLKKERLEKERLEKERLEKERLKKERLEKEHLEKERLEKERLEKERLEKERLEKERLEKERLEKERLEKERLEKERIKKERLEKQRLKKEQKERERLENETRKAESGNGKNAQVTENEGEKKKIIVIAVSAAVILIISIIIAALVNGRTTHILSTTAETTTETTTETSTEPMTEKTTQATTTTEKKTKRDSVQKTERSTAARTYPSTEPYSTATSAQPSYTQPVSSEPPSTVAASTTQASSHSSRPSTGEHNWTEEENGNVNWTE